MAPQREWFEKDYYKALSVAENASAKEITRAYRRLARQHHPDANSGNKDAEERFKEISAAYDIIGDAEKRKEYDEVRRLGPVGATFGGGGGRPGGFGFTTEGGEFGDLLGDLLGRTFRRGGPRGRTAPQRGADLEAELQLSFEAAVRGVTTSVNVTTEAACEVCHGTGAKPGTSPRPCPECGGRGVLDEDQGFFSFSTPCTVCRGSGLRIDDPCPTCRGSGMVRRPRQMKVRVPPGVVDGQRIRLAGRGAPSRLGGQPGDLLVTVRVAKNPLFGRSGRNLTITVPVTYPEAVIGANIAVPTLDGGPVTLRVPPGTKSGRTFRIRGRGVTPAKGGAGDLLVTVEVSVPATVSNEERKLIEALAAASPDAPRKHLGV